MSLTSCRVKKDFTSPVNTLKTLQQAIDKTNWELASLCFKDEILITYEKEMKQKGFYFMNTGTTQSLFKDLPIISKDAQFKLLKIENERAFVSIIYSKARDKDGRLREMTLTKTSAAEWKIDKLCWEYKPK